MEVESKHYHKSDISLYPLKYHLISDDLIDNNQKRDVNDMRLIIDYMVPVISNEIFNGVYSKCSAVFSITLQQASNTISMPSTFYRVNDLRDVLERNASLESLAENIKSPVLDLQTAIDSSGRHPSLPPRNHDKCEKKLLYLKKQLKKSSDELIVKSNLERKRLLERFNFVDKQWSQIFKLNTNQWLIEIRKRNLTWDGIPWDFKNFVYDLSLWSLEDSHITNPLLLQVKNAMLKLLFKRTFQVFENLYKNSQWWKGEVPIQVIEKFQQKFESLSYHLNVTLNLNLKNDFIWPLCFYLIINMIERPTTLPGYENYLINFFDGLILSNYYHELDIIWDKLLWYVLDQNHYKFFGNKDGIKNSMNSVRVELPELLKYLSEA